MSFIYFLNKMPKNVKNLLANIFKSNLSLRKHFILEIFLTYKKIDN